MDTSTVRYRTPEPSAAAIYWQRRFITLVVGLSALALVTWAAAAVLGSLAPAANSPATKTVHGRLPGPAAGRGAATSGGHNMGQPAGHAATIVSAGLQPCPAGDVVLSLFSSRASYSIRQNPEFEVDVVSTASRTCTFDIGARHIWLQIKTGTVRVWTSADCAEGQASLVTQLHRGVPTVVALGWNGRTSSPGCPVPGAAVPLGIYTAVASDAGSASNSLVFRIG
jgi:hypothetical protein